MNTKVRIKSVFDFVLPAALLAAFIAGFLCRSDGGINLDALMYARRAMQLPAVQDNLFPPGQPLLLRLMVIFGGDYFVAGKLLNAACLLLILCFSFYKKFFFRETLFLLCTKAGIGLWSFSFSEIPFLTALYFQFFLLFRLLDGKPGKWDAALLAALQGTFLLLRHAGLFLFPGLVISGFFLFRKGGPQELRKPWSRWLLMSIAVMAAILAWNYLRFHSFFGEQLRGSPEAVSAQEWKEHFQLNLRGLLSLANPFFSLVFQYGESSLFSRLALLADGLFLLAFLWISREVLRNGGLFASSLYITGAGYLLLLFAASFGAGIETLNTRLMAPGLWCLYFPFLLYASRRLRPDLFAAFSLACLGIGTAYLLKTPAWYPAIRARAESLLAARPEARYFVIDRDRIPPRRYSLPGTGISLTYYHPVLAESYVNRHAIMILRPEMEELETHEASVKAPASLLLNSSCRLQEGLR